MHDADQRVSIGKLRERFREMPVDKSFEALFRDNGLVSVCNEATICNRSRI